MVVLNEGKMSVLAMYVQVKVMASCQNVRNTVAAHSRVF
jgi:hypothetical protein